MVVDEDYRYKRDGKTYRLRKDISKGGWYLTLPYSSQPLTLLHTFTQMEELLETEFEKY